MLPLRYLPLLIASGVPVHGDDAVGAPPIPVAEVVTGEIVDSPATPPSSLPREYSSTSSSRQFVVHGSNPDFCSVLSTKSDDIRKEVIRLLKCPDTWKYKIGVKLIGQPGSPLPSNPIKMDITIVGDQPNFEIKVHLGKGIQLEEFTKAVTTMLLYEMTLRNVDINALPDNISLPPWLIHGIEQALLWKTDMADRNTYASLFERDGILSPETILTEKNPEANLDAATLAAYKASCGALTLCLLSQKGGEEAMLRALTESIFGTDDPSSTLKRNFPQLTLTPSSLHKWWTLQLSTMATPPMTEALSIQETEKRLAEALVLIKYDQQSRTSTSISLEDIDRIKSEPELLRQLPGLSSNLAYLSNRCFPTYRPIIIQYARIAAGLLNKKTGPGELKQQADELAELRRLSLKAAERSRDYLNWYEYTSRSSLSGTFDSYINTVNIIRNEQKELDTPVSQYLRDIEELYTLPANGNISLSARYNRSR